MNRQEFLSQFNVLYNNETSNQAPNLNGYEISVFLTKAEYECFKNYFNPKGNKYGEGFDNSPKRQIDFSNLIEEKTYTNLNNTSEVKFDDVLTDNVMFILNEQVEEGDDTCIVVPINYEEYNRIQSKPYRYPLKRQVWRIINGGESSNSFKLIGHYGKTISKYIVRFVRKPLPIIVEDEEIWPEDSEDIELTVNGWPKISQVDPDEPVSPDEIGDDETITPNIIYPDIEAPEELHQEILQRAVELAKIAWQGDLTATLTGGQRSE